MKEMAMMEKSQRRQARVRATWRDTALYGTTAMALLAIALVLPGGGWRILALAGAVVASGTTIMRGTIDYLAAVDEQERDANLWGCYVGMCAYLTLFLLDQGLRIFGVLVPYADWGIFAIVTFTVLGVFVWKRFF